jgi:hypothetical protein
MPARGDASSGERNQSFTAGYQACSGEGDRSCATRFL